MNIIDAINSGKAIKRPGWVDYIYPGTTMREVGEFIGQYALYDGLLLDDWEVKAEKKRYWQWRVLEEKGCAWKRMPGYLDDNGANTFGYIYRGWKTWEKQKIEDDYIDVEI